MSAREQVKARMVGSVAWSEETDALLDAYRAEVLADAAPPCAVCETPIEWVACPTGGWWAHHAHPDDAHDALPPGVPSRAEVLTKAADFISASGTGFPVAVRNGVGWAVRTLRRLAEETTTGDATQQPAGESTQPAPAQVWHVFEEDTGQPLPPLFTTRAAAEQSTIDRYQAAGEYSPDYSWRPAEDGSHELLAGGEPVGIYLTPVTVNGDTATHPTPDTDASTAFMQLGTTLSLAGLRAELHIEGHPPIIGRYCGFGSRRLEPGVLLIEPALLFHWADDDITEGEVPRG